MQGKIMLSSLYNCKDAKRLGYEIINIARMDMEYVETKFIELAPSYELFNWYRKNKDLDNWFESYEKVYLNELRENKRGIDRLKEIRKMLDEGKNVCLVCFCKDVDKCHRSIVGRLFENKGYVVIK